MKNTKKNKIVALVGVLIVLQLLILSQTTQRSRIWPEIEPFRKEYLKVSDIHKIYYELCGNKNGKPVFVLHGGPGGFTSPYYRRFFNPESYFIVLHDQRGAGKSMPKLELKENTTLFLVEDIEKLRKHLRVDKIILFGGSWGSTLALAYAETYPENVSAMVLRGIFTGTNEEIKHFYGGGVRPFFPEVYEQLEQNFGKTPDPAKILSSLNTEDKKKKQKFSRAWTAYELKLAELSASDDQVNNILSNKELADAVLSLALIENHYMANNCFLDKDQLLRNVDKIQHIPAFLINGRYDMICPPINAYRLHKLLPNSRLIIVERAGHSMGERYIEKELLGVMSEIE